MTIEKQNIKKLVNKTVNGLNKKHPITLELSSCNAINAVPLHCVILKRVFFYFPDKDTGFCRHFTSDLT